MSVHSRSFSIGAITAPCTIMYDEGYTYFPAPGRSLYEQVEIAEQEIRAFREERNPPQELNTKKVEQIQSPANRIASPFWGTRESRNRGG